MIEVKTKKEGAELISLKYKGKEILHDGKSYWNRQSPILFPVVGKLKENETEILGNKYQMNQHGFIRDMEFEEVEKTDKKHKYKFKSNKETLLKYPYDFEITVIYEINEKEVVVRYEVLNLSNFEMEFGIGAHPAFKCEYSLGKYIVEFEKEENDLKILKLKDGLIEKEEDIKLVNNKILELNEKSFLEDAIIFKNLKSRKCILRNKENNEKVIEMDFNSFPYFAVWSKIGAPFVCLEPWKTTADYVNSDGKFENKKDNIKLNKNEKNIYEYILKF